MISDRTDRYPSREAMALAAQVIGGRMSRGDAIRELTERHLRVMAPRSRLRMVG